LSATAVQTPAVAARLQAMQPSEHALLQHTPWAQKPDVQSFPALQLAPCGLRPQDAFAQKLPATHWLSLVQLS
jgi:hypothetical protein